mgnify:CR=1 FL=1
MRPFFISCVNSIYKIDKLKKLSGDIMRILPKLSFVALLQMPEYAADGIHGRIKHSGLKLKACFACPQDRIKHSSKEKKDLKHGLDIFSIKISYETTGRKHTSRGVGIHTSQIRKFVLNINVDFLSHFYKCRVI